MAHRGMHLAAPRPRERALVTLVSIGTNISTRDETFVVRREHWHSWQVMFTVRGEGEAEVDGRRLAIPCHSVVLLPRDRPHHYRRLPASQVWEYRWFECDGEQMPAVLALLGLGDAWSLPGCGDLLPLVEEIHALLLSDGDAALHEASMAFLRFLARIGRRARYHPEVAPSAVERAVAWMEGRLDHAIELADIAAVAGVSPWHCVRLFRQVHGVPPIAYLRLLRLHRAKTLLQTGDLGVRQVARAVGYAKVQHFTRMFTAAIGLSPSAFRAGSALSPGSGASATGADQGRSPPAPLADGP